VHERNDGIHSGIKDVRRAAQALAREIPARLAPLARVAYNFHWVWHPDGERVFRDIDSYRWRLCRQNPVRFLDEASQESLERAASDPSLVRRAEALRNSLEEDLARPAREDGVASMEHPVAFFCAEFGVHRSLPIYSGGLADLSASIAAAAHAGRVGMVGYCWGGCMAYLAGCRTNIAAGIAYYGGGIVQLLPETPRCPMLFHFGERDTHIPLADVEKIRKAYPQGTYHLYPAGHGFNCTERASFDAASAQPRVPAPAHRLADASGLRVADGLRQQHVLVVGEAECVCDGGAIDPGADHGAETAACSVQVDVLCNRARGGGRVALAACHRDQLHA
jgi:hypothetical protein